MEEKYVSYSLMIVPYPIPFPCLIINNWKQILVEINLVCIVVVVAVVVIFIVYYLYLSILIISYMYYLFENMKDVINKKHMYFNNSISEPLWDGQIQQSYVNEN